MASYITTETDMSRVTALSTDTKNFVFVPINSTWGPDDEYVELTSTTQLQNVYGGDSEVGEDGLEELTSYQYAAGVLRNGFSVLAKRVVKTKNGEEESGQVNTKAYAEDHRTSGGWETDVDKFVVSIGGKKSDIMIKCHDTEGGVHAVTAKYYGEYANSFAVICTSKFIDASHVGLYFIVKRNGITLEENLFGKLNYTKTKIGGEDVEHLKFVPSNPISTYIDFGSCQFNDERANSTNFTETENIIIIANNHQTGGGITEVTATSYTLPFANESYIYSTTEDQDVIVDKYGHNITRERAKIVVSDCFKAGGEFLTNVGDKWLYDVKFISNGGYVDTKTTDKDISTGMITIADTRQDCVAFIDTPKKCENAKNVEDYVKDQLNEKSAYAAVYAPWCRATPYGTNSTVDVPASYLAITSFAKSFASGNSICDVPAGVNRGSINIIKPQFIIGGVTQERWQRGNGEGSDLTFCINPIMNIRKYGYCIFGQRTLLELPYGSTSALQELCVRLTLNEIKRWVRDVALSLTFESNSNRTWNEFVSKTQQCLDKLVAGGYLTNYKIIRSTDNTNQVNTNSLNATIQAYVTRALENFNINVEVFSGEVTFTETTE